MSNLTDIIRKSVKGHPDAQRELYERYRTKWFMLAMRYGKNRSEAEDILQEGLIRIYKDLHQYDDRRSQFSTWSGRLIVHAALHYLKKNQWHKAILDIDSVDIEGYDGDEIYSKLAAKELTLLIQGLPIGYRIVFNMYVLEGYTHKEIADKLGIKEGTSKSQLFKAKKELRHRLESQLTKYSYGK